MRTAIFYSYYYPSAFSSLEQIFNYVAVQYNTDFETVRNGIRSSLIPLNNTNFNYNNKFFKLFDSTRNITPKYFLEVIVTYLHYKKNKK